MFDRFTDRAKMSLNRARTAAQEFGHSYIAPEHVLLGLLGVGECGATRMLAAVQADPRTLLEDLRGRMRPGEANSLGQLFFTAEMKQVLESSMAVAAAAGHNHIGTEHLLRALAHVSPSIVGKLFREQGLTCQRLEPAFVELGNESEDVESSGLLLQRAAPLARKLGDEETARKIEALIQRLPR